MSNQGNRSGSLGLGSQLILSCLSVGLLALISLSIFETLLILLVTNRDWSDGFHHPLEGWDHILAMLAVGVWSAQLRGQTLWILPLMFVSFMSLGGFAGAASIILPGAEIMILLSNLVFCLFIIRKVRFTTGTHILIVALFAFFHGYAHGEEITASANLISYTLGFVFATLLLHGAGIVITRLLVFILAFFMNGNIHAQKTKKTRMEISQVTANQQMPASRANFMKFDEITITAKDRGDSQLGIADSASQGNIGQAQLQFRPITRPGEVLETVPGLIATQHSGEGKANQFFLRGFNLDHGTDFLTHIEDVPINQLSHSHGQGWTDTNFLIPELIETLEYKKGSYYAENGDFSSAGSANIRYFKSLPETVVKFTGGSFDYYRGLIAGSHQLGAGNLLFAGEALHNDGPWTTGNNYLKFNGVLRYSVEYDDHGWSITGMASKADWRATDQIARRALEQGIIDRYDALDPTDGGESQRYSLTGEWHRQDANSISKVTVYGLYSQLDLFSNFTFFLDNNEFSNPAGCSRLNRIAQGKRFNPIIFNTCGDQFGQPDKRWTTGFKASHTIFHKMGIADSETTLGLQIRNDNIRNALTRTHAQNRFDVRRKDTIWVTSLSPYAENRTYWNRWLRSTLGVRFDGFRFDVSNSNIQANDGERYDGLVSPKGAIVLGPWADTELYLNAGLGFHSNDARGVNSRIDPISGDPIPRADPLARTYSAEIGIRSTWIKGLQSTLAIWWLDTQSELVFVGDAGATEASRPGRRYGLEFANFYSPVHWLTLDADFSFSHARFRDNAPEGDYIPNAVETVIAAGATFHNVFGGLFGGPRLRYFGPRPLIEDNSQRSDGTLLLSAMLGYQVSQKVSLQAEIFNILDRNDDAITYFYTSRLPGESVAGVDDFHFHPVEPVSFRMSFILKF